MRNTRFVVALAAVACVAALPAAAAANAANKGKPESKAAKHGHGTGKGHGKGHDASVTRLVPATGQKAAGAAHLKQRAGALSVSLVVGKLTPGAFYAAHLHSRLLCCPGRCGNHAARRLRERARRRQARHNGAHGSRRRRRGRRLRDRRARRFLGERLGCDHVRRHRREDPEVVRQGVPQGRCG